MKFIKISNNKLQVEFNLSKEDYRYSYMKEKTLIFRYNNYPHHKEVDTFLHHKHIKNKIESANESNLSIILREINEIILKRRGS